MKQKYFLLFLLAVVIVANVTAQQRELTPGEKILAEGELKNPFDKKLRFGVSWNQYWGTIKGSDLPENYFAKPCIGFNLRAEYYPLSFIGIGIGWGVQQRGAGIINPDYYGGSFTHPWEPNYDPDSTYRERLRMYTIETPITILLRTPKEVVKDVKLSAAAGIVLIKNNYVKKFFHKPEDGFHTITPVTKDYISGDIGYQFSGGVEVNAGGSCILQVHLVYSKGTKNIYKTEDGNGRVETYGFRVACLY